MAKVSALVPDAELDTGATDDFVARVPRERRELSVDVEVVAIEIGDRHGIGGMASWRGRAGRLAAEGKILAARLRYRP